MPERTSMRIEISPEYRDMVEFWYNGLQFGSKKQTTETLLALGAMALEIVATRPLTSREFASALYMVGSRVLEGEVRDNVEKTVEEFQRWRETQSLESNQPRSLTKKLGPVNL